MEVIGPPEIALLHLLVIDHLISEGHNAKVGLIWEHPSIWFQEHISRNNISLQHSFVQQECS